MPPEDQSATVRETDPFVEAFERLSSMDTNASPTEVDRAMKDTVTAQPEQQPEPAQTEPEQHSEQPVEGQEAAQEGQEAAQEGQEAAQEPVKQPVKEPAADEDLLRRLSELMRQKAPEEQPRDTSADTVKQPDTQPEAPPLYSKEEQEFLETYAKEWPDVARAEALRRRGEYRELAQYFFSEVATFLKPHIEQLQAVATRTHLADIESRVTDYDDVRDKVVEWVGQQPKYLQTAYQYVIEQGTVEEVMDLIDRWRAATGSTVSSAAPVAQQQRPKETVLPPATKQAAAALAPVGSKRSAPTVGLDPSDFDSAFAAAAAGKD